MAAHGTFHWNELMTHDVNAARKFYEDTIGWTFESMPMENGTYWVAKANGTMVGGMFEMQGPDFANMPDQWMAYLAVDDVDARVKKASAAGAKIMRPPFDVPGVGRIAILRQPHGDAMIGWMTPSNP
jgi:predicted enzyme related to lactoylglutathione lyase